MENMITKQKKVTLAIALFLFVQIAFGIWIAVYHYNHPEIPGTLILEHRRDYDVFSTLAISNQNHQLHEIKNSYQEEYSFLSFDFNSDAMLGVHVQGTQQKQKIVLLNKMDDNRLSVQSEIYTNPSSSPVASPKSIPNSRKISFRQNNEYYIYDPISDTKEKIAIMDAHNVIWLDSDTLLYTQVHFPNLGDIEIRKHSISSKQDAVYIEGGYGCSLSYNRRYLAYGLVGEPSQIHIRDLETNDSKSVQVPASTYADRTKYRALKNDDGNYEYLNIVLAKGAAEMETSFEAVLLGNEDLYDGCAFQPNSDGSKLIFASNRGKVLLYDVNANTSRVLSGMETKTIQWKT